MTFEVSHAEQGSKEWLDIRIGKVTASRLGDWLSVSKRDGKPLKARSDYEQELNFEHTFRVSFERPVTQAMRLGTELEPVVRQKYEEYAKVSVETVGCYWGKNFVASPDGLVGKDGMIEIKVLGDKSFAALFVEGVPDNYFLQMQGNLFANGRKWADFIAYNPNSGRIYVERVKRDEEVIGKIAESLEGWEPKRLDASKTFEARIKIELEETLPINEGENVWS